MVQTISSSSHGMWIVEGPHISTFRFLDQVNLFGHGALWRGINHSHFSSPSHKPGKVLRTTTLNSSNAQWRKYIVYKRAPFLDFQLGFLITIKTCTTRTFLLHGLLRAQTCLDAVLVLVLVSFPFQLSTLASSGVMDAKRIRKKNLIRFNQVIIFISILEGQSCR